MIKFGAVVCLCILYVVGDLDLFRPKTVRFNVFKGRCSEYPNAPVYYSNVLLATMNRTFYVSMDIHITRDIPSKDLKLILYLKRCASSESLDSCENYNTIKINHFCKILSAENQPWTPFKKLMHPPTKGCPLQKGVHSVRNGTFDGSAFRLIPINNFYWKVTVHIVTVPEEEVILCNQVEGQVAPI